MAGTYADSAGRAYLYERPEGGWTDAAENATLDTGGTDYIGMSVAIDESGDTIAVGDPWYNGLEVDTGSVYVFHKPLGGWSGNVNFNARLTASDLLAEDYLGKSVVLTADGGTLVAGAAGYDAGGSERGALYVYESPPGGWATTNSFDAKLTVGDAHNSDHLGDTVAISADGRTVVAGAEGYNGIYNNIGAVYVYERPGVDWNSTAVFSARLTASDAEEGDKLGSSIAVSGDGSTIAAGAYMQDVTGTGINRGAVYVFERPAGGWATTNHFEAMLTASDGQDGDHLGGSDSLAICNTGGTIAVGANLHDLDGDNRGAVYVFERPVSGWGSTDEFDAKLTSDEAEDDDRLGHAVGISGDASTIGVGSPGQDAGGLDNGAVYVYLRQPGGWTSTADFHAKLTASDGVHEDYFGIDQIALDDTGTTVIVGYPATNDDRGAVYVFTRPTSGWSSTIEQAQLSASDGIAFDLFGKSAAISLDGSTVISGAYYHNDSRGAVYVYKRPEGGWESTDAFFAKLTASDAGWDDSFGYSASVSGDGSVVISGARDEFRTGGVGQGSAYIFAYYAAPLFTSGAPPSPIPVGSLYSHTFKTTNFPESTFSITSGSLPPGLALDSPSGLLTGTPDTVGTYNFTVTASNGIDPDATQDATIVVQPGTYHCFLPVLSNGD